MTEQDFIQLPAEVQSVLNTWDENTDLYAECRRIQAQLNDMGWDCDWGLDGEISTIMPLDK